MSIRRREPIGRMCLLAGMVSVLCGCADGPSRAQQEPSMEVAGNAADGEQAAGTGGEASPVRLCPANNLTQACNCDDGSSGRQVCIESRGWGTCDCGQLTGMTSDEENLNSAPGNPPANMNVGVTFEDYVMPRSVGNCSPGRYEGTFECTYTEGVTLAPFWATGVVSFALERSTNSEVLEIREGLLDGWGAAFFFAYLSGELDCLTGDFEGTASDGFWNPVLKGCSGMPGDMPGNNCIITDPQDPNYVPWTVTLEGDYQGSLDSASNTIDGTWAMTPLDVGGVCDGTFTVTLVP